MSDIKVPEINALIRECREYKQLIAAIKEQRRQKPLPMLVNGLSGGAEAAFLVSLAEDLRASAQCPVLFLCQDQKQAEKLSGLISRSGLRSAAFPGRDLMFYNAASSREFEHERLGILHKLCAGAGEPSDAYPEVIVTSPDAALCFTIPPDKLAESALNISSDQNLEPETLTADLLAAGYSRADQASGAGQFARRGGIIDIYPPSGIYKPVSGETLTGAIPVRLEFFGDEIDRMGTFDPETQRVTDNVTRVSLSPAREMLCGENFRVRLRKHITARLQRVRDERVRGELSSELAALDAGAELNFIDKYMGAVYENRACLLDYFPASTSVVLCDTAAVSEAAAASQWHAEQNAATMLESGSAVNRPDFQCAEYAAVPDELEGFCDEHISVHVSPFLTGLGSRRLGGLFAFRTKHTISYAEKIDLLCEDIGNYINNSYRTIVACDSEPAAKNMAGMLAERGFSAVLPDGGLLNSLAGGQTAVVYGYPAGGFELPAAKIAVLSAIPDGGRVSRRGAAARAGINGSSGRGSKSAAQKILSYADLIPGDYVVHAAYGIGQFTGIENLEIDGVSRDYIHIKYAGNDKLFLPVDQLDMVSKYIGAKSEDGQLKLSKFGGAEWGRAKSRAKAAAKEMAGELIRLYAERERKPGFAFPEDDDFQADFETAFEYEETRGQLEAAFEIKRDMTMKRPMDRLLCGDVGFGKTEIALRAAFKAILGGKQTALLVPTTILALQHYQTALTRFRSFPVKIDMVSRFRTPRQQAEALRRLRRGEIDLIIGTHRLVSDDVKFKDLGLVIIDEEQRFGVVQKEKLKRFATGVDVLTLTATPIPRTLNMAMSGIRDISVLDEGPGDRLPIQTYVLEHETMIIGEAVRRELRRGGQVFYLHNDIGSISSAAAKLAEAAPDARITIAHGRMDRDVLEEIWHAMIRGDIDILVSTTIIETGVDVPNANTLIVDNADRLGLSQLHQLRGRIGRSSRRAYAYFTYPRGKVLSEIASKRLEAIREYAEFGAGFRIALRDLEIRGAGNILGAEQHGHLNAVGYDMYIRLLNDAILEERGQTPAARRDCVLDLRCDAYLPDGYIRSSAQRMDIYKKVALIENELDRRDIADEMLDRFGEIPRPAEQLMTIALCRAMGIAGGINKVEQREGHLHIYPATIDIELWSELSRKFTAPLRIVMTGTAYISCKIPKGTAPQEVLLDLLKLQMAASGK